MTWVNFLNWFAGGNEHPYHRLFSCMREDKLWVAITIALDVAVASGYILIAKHWWSNAKAVSDSPAKRALASMRNIFVLCGICGYAFIPIKMFWPAWRLYDMFMVFLVYATWKYAWGAKDLKVLYTALGKNESLARELQASREDARRKGFFLNAVSHDLRTPLNGLMLQTELAEMARDQRDHELLKKALAEIKACAAATGDLLNCFLEIGRLDGSPDDAKLETFALADLMSVVLKINSPAAESAGLWLRLSGAEAGMLVRTDQMKLERVLNNLINNAIKFTKKGGVEVVLTPSGNDLEIAVIDSGIGIAPEHRERLFEEFYQVQNHERDRRKGFGLGLAISRRLVHVLGGELAVTSEVGVGSRFTIRLPGVVEPRPRIIPAGQAIPDAVPVGV